MTHKELLAKLWILPADVTELEHGAKAVQALREVVELCDKWETRGSYCLPIEEVIWAIEKEVNKFHQ